MASSSEDRAAPVDNPPRRPRPGRRPRLDLHAVWARWAVRATTTGDPWAYHVCEFYRRLALMETHHEP